jgi:hypothetical protein
MYRAGAVLLAVYWLAYGHRNGVESDLAISDVGSVLHIQFWYSYG